jgi:hypothetical protein
MAKIVQARFRVLGCTYARRPPFPVRRFAVSGCLIEIPLSVCIGVLRPSVARRGQKKRVAPYPTSPLSLGDYLERERGQHKSGERASPANDARHQGLPQRQRPQAERNRCVGVGLERADQSVTDTIINEARNWHSYVFLESVRHFYLFLDRLECGFPELDDSARWSRVRPTFTCRGWHNCQSSAFDACSGTGEPNALRAVTLKDRGPDTATKRLGRGSVQSRLWWSVGLLAMALRHVKEFSGPGK